MVKRKRFGQHMSDEIRFGWNAGQTNIKADVFQPDGSVREINIALVENATGRLYLGDCATIVQDDIIVIHQNGIYLASYGYNDGTGYTLASDGLDSISIVEPTGYPTNFREFLMWLVMRWLNKHVFDLPAGELKVKKGNDAAATTQTYTKVDGVETVGKATE